MRLLEIVALLGLLGPGSTPAAPAVDSSPSPSIKVIRSVAPAAETVEPATARSPMRLIDRLFAVLGTFSTLALLAMGLVVFGRQHLEVVSDTSSHSFLRAFVVGLVGQVVAVPLLGLVVAGLIVSVIGVLLVPFVLVVAGLLVLVAVIGGFLGAAHAMGERYTRRQMARGLAVSPNSFRYLAIGLTAVAALWAAWVLLGGIPFAGAVVLTAAVVVTWLVGTVGLGACILSRGGLQPTFAGRYLPTEMLTDEYLWATPQHGVPAVKRPARLP